MELQKYLEMNRILKYISILSLPIFILLIFFLALERENQYTTKNLVGKKIQDFELKSLNQENFINQESLIGNNYTLINFWASWCAPCREENSALIEIKNQLGLKILGINFKDKKNHAKNFLKDYGNPYYTIGVDKDGTTSVNFGVFGIPESILIDKNFIILKKFIGPIEEEDFMEIKNIINK